MTHALQGGSSQSKAAPVALLRLRRLLAPLLVYSFATNLAILISPIFMMQVLDRVVPSGNLGTLYLLLMIALLAQAASGFVEYTRDLSLHRSARWADALCRPRLLQQNPDAQAEGLNHLNLLRDVLSGPRALALLNLFWLPLFVLCLGLIHPGYLILLVAIVGLSAAAKAVATGFNQDRTDRTAQLLDHEKALLRQLELIGVQPRMQHVSANILSRFGANMRERDGLEDAIDRTGLASGGLSSFLRMAAQLLALSLGAYFVSQGTLTAGGMIAASLITAKAIAIAEQSLEAAASGPAVWTALRALARTPATDLTETEARPLNGALTCDGLIVPRGGGHPPRLDRIRFELAPGTCLGIIGDAGGGKSTLLLALAGLAPAPIGTVYLDQTDVRQLGPATRAAAIGHVPQMAALLPGTLAENISGFDPQETETKVIAAAKTARVHGLISALPEGYQTDLRRNPLALTAGQKQQVALAAALYHQPRYLFLDEPNALLDRHAERALCETLGTLKADGVTIVMVLHRAGIMGLADQVLSLDRGRVADFGPRAQVLGRQTDGRRTIRLPLRATSLQDLADWITGQFTRSNDAAFAAKAVMLGTELFQAACVNGPDDEKRDGLFKFTFIDDEHCELSLSEERPTTADGVLPRVRTALCNGQVDTAEFSPEELPLVLASKLAKTLEVTNANNRSCFSALLQADPLPEAGARPH
ncbi:MAG: ATP-binding cassette domain-containing protein [Pseudomonadota bacterium]